MEGRWREDGGNVERMRRNVEGGWRECGGKVEGG